MGHGRWTDEDTAMCVTHTHWWKRIIVRGCSKSNNMAPKIRRSQAIEHLMWSSDSVDRVQTPGFWLAVERWTSTLRVGGNDGWFFSHHPQHKRNMCLCMSVLCINVPHSNTTESLSYLDDLFAPSSEEIWTSGLWLWAQSQPCFLSSTASVTLCTSYFFKGPLKERWDVPFWKHVRYPGLWPFEPLILV